ncbi:MAG: hypothetical protein ABI894_18000, partial [Ilumatobacteraceae bacterium]
PSQAIVDLCHSHHELWHARGNRIETGLAGVTAVLHRMRPTGTAISRWRQHVDIIVETAGFAA